MRVVILIHSNVHQLTRYGDVNVQSSQTSSTVTKLPNADLKVSPISTGKKFSKNPLKPSTSSKNFTDEDTCNSDDFSSYYQINAARPAERVK